jgi:UDP-N-acetylmuramoyl-L-alanyl-D-glutamate--2,6-diaminopimelate ligase
LLLKDVLYKVALRSVAGSTDSEVKDVQIDSRRISNGSVFIAVKGVAMDGHEFIDKAVDAGAKTIVCEELPASLKENINYVQVENSAEAAAHIAHNFYGQPSEKLKLVGVTGTNGKTTIATLLYKLFTSLGYKCGLLSTVENIIGDKAEPSTSYNTGYDQPECDIENNV